MEYEIYDDPQGQPDRPDGDRQGGLREDRLFFRRDAPAKRLRVRDDAGDEDWPIQQFGEAA